MEESTKILIIEADASPREKLVTLLKEMGHQPIVAADSGEGKDLFRSEAPPIVFLDLDLLAGTAANLTRELVAEKPDTLIVILTEASDEKGVLDAFRAGASDYLTKPIPIGELRAVLSSLLGVVSRRENKVLRDDFFVEGDVKLVIGSQSKAVSPAVNHMTYMLQDLLEPRELNRVELALHEAIRNAYEHGNLGLSGEKKAELCEKGGLEKWLVENEVASAHKPIRIQARLRSQEFECSVEDQGEGFDWRARFDADGSGPVAVHMLHGRGIFLINRVFDRIVFNDRGNKITMRKSL